MAMSKAAKAALKENLSQRLEKANAAMVAEYRGLTVEDLTKLRVKLKEAKAEFKVVKNRVAKVAIKESVPKMAPMAEKLKGPVGLVLVYGDPAAVAKSLVEFSKDNEKFVVTGGVFDGQALEPKDLKAIADLPSREVLLAQIVGSLVNPHRGLLGVLSGVQRQLVTVLNAIKDKKSE